MADINKLFQDINYHILNDLKPSVYLNEELAKGNLNEYPFTMLSVLPRVDQNPQYHPEGNVWIHTMLVLDNAAEHKNESEAPRAFMWGALLHDIGKAETTRLRKGRLTSYDHDKVGEELAVEFFKSFEETEEFVYKVVKLVRWHMQTFFVVKGMSFANVEEMKKETSTKEIALLSLCDRLGRRPLPKEKEIEEKENIELFLQKVK